VVLEVVGVFHRDGFSITAQHLLTVFSRTRRYVCNE